MDLPSDDPKKRNPDIRKAKKYLDWQPNFSLEEGLKKTIVYFRELWAEEQLNMKNPESKSETKTLPSSTESVSVVNNETAWGLVRTNNKSALKFPWFFIVWYVLYEFEFIYTRLIA